LQLVIEKYQSAGWFGKQVSRETIGFIKPRVFGHNWLNQAIVLSNNWWILLKRAKNRQKRPISSIIKNTMAYLSQEMGIQLV